MELSLASIANQHPRLLVAESTFDRLRDRNWDASGEALWQFFEESGSRMLDLEPVSRELIGMRLLGQSRAALKRIVTWSLLYRVNGDPEFRDRAIREIETAIAFSDWNPSHFLDVGEMALAVAIGADWLWDDLNEDQRNRILAALKEKAILPSLDEDHPDNWWIYYYNNWNPVCHAGLVASALMLAGTEPVLAERVIRRAIRALPAAMAAYQPAGAYPEGPVYWDYGTSFTAILLDLLENAFGTTFELDADPAFRASGTFRAVTVTPTGQFYNYADCGRDPSLSEACAWFASRYGDAAARYELKRGLQIFLEDNNWTPEGPDDRLLPFVALWYPGAEDPGASGADLPELWLGPGPNPIALVRENWGDPNGFFLGFKGNDASVSHAHMDAGSFIFEDEGVRWAIDLGAQSYNSIEQYGLGIWDRRQHADRWRIFRVGPYSHNILLIDQRPRDATTKADITKLAADEGGRIHGIVDLSAVMVGQAESVERHFHVFDHRVLRIVDEVRGARQRTENQGRSPATLRWRMLTQAVVEINDTRATLRQDGKTLHLVVQAPSRINLRADPVDPPPYFWDAPNPGVTAIDIWTMADVNGNQTVSVLMSTDAEALEDHMDAR